MAPFPLRPLDRSVLELGFLSQHNPFDRRSFSGTAFFSARARADQPGVNLRILGPHRPPTMLDRVLKRKPPEFTADEIDIEGLDAVIGLVATPLLDRLTDLHPDVPALHVTDATPAFLSEAYGWRISAQTAATETRVVRKAARVVYSSYKIAERSAADLGLPGLRADTAPFGVNFEHLPETCPTKPSLDRLNLLFVGLDWERKGGDIAVAALDQLIAQGNDARLTIVGRCPERHRGHPQIVNMGFLNKNRPKDADLLSRLYRQSHLLLLPSRADCTPMVISEAMAHGTPVLASDTGGVASQVGAPGTGRLLPLFSTPEDWVTAILDITSDPLNYGLMSDAAFDRAQNTLSWRSWADSIEHLVRQTLVETAARPAMRA